MKASLVTSLVMVSSLMASVRADTQLEVVASVLPVHSLVSAVTHGIVTPRLILPGNASPHFHQLRPSQARALHNADVVFWVGPSMETFLARSITGLAPEAQVVGLLRAPGINLLPNREHLNWIEPEEEDGYDHDERSEHAFDAHIWLSPDNAAHMIREIVRVLGSIDPANRVHYQNNADRALTWIALMDQDVTARLAAVRQKPFVVFHDAYGYLEDHYGLSALGAITVNPDRPPSAKRVAVLQKAIRHHGARCVFVEPQYSASWVRTLSADNQIQTGILDPMGADLEPGVDAYFTLMRNNAEALVDCLSD